MRMNLDWYLLSRIGVVVAVLAYLWQYKNQKVKDLIAKVIQMVLAAVGMEIDLVTKEIVYQVAADLYTWYLPHWLRWIGKETVQAAAWYAWQEFVKWWESGPAPMIITTAKRMCP